MRSILVLPDISAYLSSQGCQSGTQTFLESQGWQRSVPTDRHSAQLYGLWPQLEKKSSAEGKEI